MNSEPLLACVMDDYELLVSIFPNVVLFYNDDCGARPLCYWRRLPDTISFNEGEEYEYEHASEPLLAPGLVCNDRWRSSPVVDFPSVVLIMNNWPGNEFLRLYLTIVWMEDSVVWQSNDGIEC